MIDEVRKQLHRVPFVPFSVRTSDGQEYSVPTVDHAYITPRGNRVIVTDDKGTVAILGPLHINCVIEQPNGA
jgi:outer membrane lipoprotein SlyB